MARAKTSPAKSNDLHWQAKAEDYLKSWQRTQADFDNYRRRTETERHDLATLAATECLLQIAPILDDFRRAFAHIPEDEQASPWLAGIRQVEKHLRSLLTRAGLEPIESGGLFDPTVHEAIAYEEHPELPDGTIIDIVELGWKVGNRVIKPARVRVSKGKTSDQRSEISE